MSNSTTKERPRTGNTRDEQALTLERKFNHPPETVFKAWTEPAALRQWMGPEGYSCPSAEIDAKTGGVYVIPMIAPVGSIHTVRGVIKDLIPNELMRFSWAWDQEDGSAGQMMEVTVEFHKSGGGTRLVLTQTNFIDEDAREKHQGGWQGCLNSLANYLEG